MKISVIVPIYNVEAYLRECLDSILNQKIEDMEAILVNDGSTDQSGNIMNEYQQKYPKLFTCIHKPNGGLGDARNTGAALAKGEYLAFLDSDDFYCEGALQKLLYFAKSKEADIVCCDFYWYYDEQNKEVRKTLPREFHKMDAKTYILSNPSAWNRIVKREVYEKVKTTFPPRLWYEDLATTPAFVLATQKIAYLEEPCINYRQREQSIMAQSKYSPRLLEINQAIKLIDAKLRNSEYQKEMEYLAFFQLLYYASFRFLEFHESKAFEECLLTLEELYPNWRENPYYLTKPKAFKLYCQFLQKRQFKLAKLLIKLRGGN